MPQRELDDYLREALGFAKRSEEAPPPQQTATDRENGTTSGSDPPSTPETSSPGVTGATTVPGVTYPREVLFESGPGFWKFNELALAAFLLGLVLMCLYGAGALVWAYLAAAAANSKADWRMREIMRAIYETRAK